MYRRTILLFALVATPAAADWKAQADPPASKVEWPTDLKVEIPTKALFDPEVTFADQGGPFVALGRNSRDEAREFFDLRTSKRIGELRGEVRLEKRALSPDGKLFAGLTGTFGKQTVTVFDTATGKSVAEMPAPKGADFIAFPTADRLAFQGGLGDKNLHVHEAATGKELADYPIIKAFRRCLPAFSPGGKYVAVCDSDDLILFSTADGTEVGRTTTKTPPAKAGDFRFFNPDGLGFSADGTLLAAVSTVGPAGSVLVWSVADSNLVADVALEKGTSGFYDGPRIQWVPDGSAWLINGSAVYDRESGKILFRVPDGGRGHRRAAGAGAVLYFDFRDGNNRALRLASMPADKLAAIRASVRGGGTALDALLPKVKEVDADAAPEAEIALPGAAWATTPDALPATTAVARRPVPLPFAINYKGPGIASVHVSSGDKPVAVFDLTTTDRPFGPVHERRIATVSLTTGKETASLTTPPDCGLAATSADGSFAVTTDAENRRVDVWSLATGKHVVGWRPYPKAADKDRKLKLVAVSGDRVLTINAGNQLVAWQLADAKPVYRAALPGLTAATLSPGGKHLVAMQQGVVRFLEAATGTIKGDLEPKTTGVFDEGGVNAVAVRSDGGEVAAIFNTPDRMAALARWDAKGKLIEQVPFNSVAYGAVNLCYAGPDHLLVDHRSLYDVKRKAIVWTYVMGGDGKFTSRAPDARLWYVLGDARGAASLVAVALPEEGVEAHVKDVIDGPNAVLKPGKKVGVNLAFTGAFAEPAKATAKDMIRRTLQDRGLVYAEAGGDLMLDGAVSQKETGDSMEFRRLFSGLAGDPREKLTVKEIELTCTAKLSAGAEAVWTPPLHKLHMREIYGIIRLPDRDTNLTDYLYKQVWDRVPAWAATAGLPRYLAKTDGGTVALPGMSMLQAGGPLTHKPGKGR